VVHFPGTEGFDFPFPFDTPIGFDIEEKWKLLLKSKI
jgi:hypothetical protein